MLPRSWADLRSQPLHHDDRHLVTWMRLARNAKWKSSVRRGKQSWPPHLSHQSAGNSNQDASGRDEPGIRPQRLQVPKGKEAGVEASLPEGGSVAAGSHLSGDDLQPKAATERSRGALSLILRLAARREDRPHDPKAAERGTIWFQLRRDPWQRAFTPQANPKLGKVLLIYMTHSRHSHFISFLNYPSMVLLPSLRSASSCCRTAEAARVFPSGSSTTTRTRRWGCSLKSTGWSWAATPSKPTSSRYFQPHSVPQLQDRLQAIPRPLLRRLHRYQRQRAPPSRSNPTITQLIHLFV